MATTPPRRSPRLTQARIRRLFDQAEMERSKYPRLKSVILEDEGQTFVVDGTLLGLRLFRRGKLVARRFGMGL